MKVCRICKIEKENSEFYQFTRNADGMDWACKPCKKIKAREQGKDSRAKYKKKWKLKNQEKVQAWSLFKSAKASGKLAEQPCQVCGETKVEGHHPDYSKPLEVIWLCQPCHRQLHHNIPV